MTTLADVTLAVARLCAEIADGTATGGSATTVVDTGITHPNDFWNNGTIWLRSGNNIGKSAVITDYASASWTWTFATLTLLCAAGDLYSVCSAAYPRSSLIGAINQALLEMGKVTTKNTSLTGLATTWEYTLPAGVSNLTRVVVGVSPNYSINYFWEEVGGKLRFANGYQPQLADEIILYYAGAHAVLALDADVVNAMIPIEQLEWLGALYAMRARINLVGGNDTRLQGKIIEATQRTETLKTQFLPRFGPKDPRLAAL